MLFNENFSYDSRYLHCHHLETVVPGLFEGGHASQLYCVPNLTIMCHLFSVSALTWRCLLLYSLMNLDLISF